MINIRTGLKIRCDRKEDAQKLLRYLDNIGYFWRDGKKLTEEDRFESMNGKACYALRERDGAKTVVLAMMDEDVVDFLDINIPVRHESGVDSLINHLGLIVYCETEDEARQLARHLNNIGVFGTEYFLEKYREGRADCCRVVMAFGDSLCVETGMYAKYWESTKHEIVRYADLYGEF